MNSYRVMLDDLQYGVVRLVFHCEADDKEHAAEQAEDAYRGCRIVKVKKIHSLGIDVLTASKDKVITRLKALKSTVSVSDGGEYHEDPCYSQVHIETTMSEGKMDDWLYGDFVHHKDYVGVFERKEKE